MTYFTKRYHPPGTPPGTLKEAEGAAKLPLRIQLMDYTATELTEQELDNAADCRPYLESPTMTWIHISGTPDPDTLRQLGKLFELHPLALEDVLNSGQRPKADSFDEQLFVVLGLPVPRNGRIEMEQISLFAGDNYLISFHPGPNDPFASLRRRLRNHTGKLRGRRSDYLLYSLLDIAIDAGFPVLEEIGDRVEQLEDELLEAPARSTLRSLHELKRELLLLRRMLWPQRELLNTLIRDDFPMIHEQTVPYLRDCYDHTVQIMDLLETYRDMCASMMDVYLSSISNRLNESMRVLTIIATIFIPLTFIAGVYGMNFRNDASPWAMPELSWYYGYPLVWLIMIVVAAGMVVYFRRKGWF